MTAALEPCPNPECPGSEPVIDQHPQILTSKAVRVVCLGCQTCGPLRNTGAEARRLWNLIPRTPRWTSEPPTVVGDYMMRYASLPQHTRFQHVSQRTIDEAPPGFWQGQEFAGPYAIPQPPSPAERSDL